MPDSSSSPTPASSGRPNHPRGIPQGIAYAPPLYLIVSKIVLATHAPTFVNDDLYMDDLVIPIFPDLRAAYDQISHDMVRGILPAMTRTNPDLWTPASPEDMQALD